MQASSDTKKVEYDQQRKSTAEAQMAATHRYHFTDGTKIVQIEIVWINSIPLVIHLCM